MYKPALLPSSSLLHSFLLYFLNSHRPAFILHELTYCSLAHTEAKTQKKMVVFSLVTKCILASVQINTASPRRQPDHGFLFSQHQ